MSVQVHCMRKSWHHPSLAKIWRPSNYQHFEYFCHKNQWVVFWSYLHHMEIFFDKSYFVKKLFPSLLWWCKLFGLLIFFLLHVYEVKAKSSILHSKRHILSIWSLIQEFFISLERSFLTLSSDASCFSRFCSRNILLSFCIFFNLVDILVVSGSEINFVASDGSSWVVLFVVPALCPF